MGSPADEPPMPSPWAAAVALLALLGFGVFVGSTLTPAQGSARLVLAAAPRGASVSRPTPPASPSASPAPSPAAPEASSETASSEAAPQAPTTTTTVSSPSPPPASGRSPNAPAGGGGPASSASELPSIQHVFLIVLSDEGETAAFGAGSQAPFLSKTLRNQGELIEGYYAVSAGELANGIALVSGQGPTPQTAEDCPLYTALTPASAGKLGQALGSGCVYPSTTLTVADQLTNAGKTWRAYVEGVENGSASGAPASCPHPALGAADDAHAPQPGDAYVTWRNPFVYFQSLTSGNACSEDDVGLEQLAPDLKRASRTPSLAYVVPDRCHDGSPLPCAPGQGAGLPPADAFLRKVVPEIEGSQGYREGGLIAITFDQAPQSGAQADPSGCCLSSPFPNLPASGSPTSGAPAGGAQTGGGKVGLLLISKYVKPDSFNATGEYDHFSLLRSIENLFALQPLGYAGEPGLLAFDQSVFNASAKR